MLKAKFSRVLTTSAVDHLMEKVQKKIYEKRSTKFYTQSLAKNISITNQQSIEQIASNLPKKSSQAQQDNTPGIPVEARDRPFSAKIETLDKTVFKPMIRNSTQKSLRNSARKNINSYKSIRSYGSRTILEQKSSHPKISLIPLQINHQEDDTQDKLIQKLRKQKLKKQEYQNKKQKFIKSINKENELCNRDHSKFMSSYNTKQHTYGYSGNLIEIPKKSNNKKLMKKTCNNHTIKTAGKKGDDDCFQHQTFMIEYQTQQIQDDKKQYLFTEVVNKQMKLFEPQVHQKKNIKFTLICQDN